MKTLLWNSRLRVSALLSALLLAVVGCGNKASESESQGGPIAGTSEAIPDTESMRAAGATVTLAGITFTPPANWRSLGASGMRKAQYTLQPVGGDAAAAEVNAYYFGPSAGGSVDANLERWIGQMKTPEGSATDTDVERRDFEVAGLKTHLVAVNGSYDPGMGRPMGGGGEVHDGYRLVGVVVEAPEGNVFFKLTGPRATAEAMEHDLVRMIEGIQPAAQG
jgi:hypothetical protein